MQCHELNNNIMNYMIFYIIDKFNQANNINMNIYMWIYLDNKS